MKIERQLEFVSSKIENVEKDITQLHHQLNLQEQTSLKNGIKEVIKQRKLKKDELREAREKYSTAKEESQQQREKVKTTEQEMLEKEFELKQVEIDK